MDVATLVGVLIAWGAVAVSLMVEGGSLSELFNLSAFVLVVFGTIGATVMGTGAKTLVQVPGILKAAGAKSGLRPAETLDRIVDMARKARSEGILSLEEEAEASGDPFLAKGVHLVVDGTPSIAVREILETEIAAMEERHRQGESIFTRLGGFSPTLGIIGTVMGLINMLARLNEPGKMGHAIAAAFVATLYGVALANLVYLPIAAKLKARTAEEVVVSEMIIEGLLAIQSGDNPRMVETRVAAYLSPGDRPGREEKQPTRESEEDLLAA